MSEKNSDPKATPGPAAADFVFQLYLILVGVALGISVGNLLSERISISSVSRFLTVIVLLMNWLHGQVSFGLSETYEFGHNWFSRVIEHYVEIASAILIMTTALVQTKEMPFYWVVLASYGFDGILEFAYVRRLRSAGSRYQREREVAQSWLYIDVVASVLLAAILGACWGWRAFAGLPASISAFVIVLVVTFWDYSQNRDFYFGLPRHKGKASQREKQ